MVRWILMKNYKRLRFDEREEISRMLAQSCSLHAIAKSLDRHVSTISREVRAGSCNKYTYRALQTPKGGGEGMRQHDDIVDALRYSFLALRPPWYKRLWVKIKIFYQRFWNWIGINTQ